MAPVRQERGAAAQLQERAEALAAGVPPLLAAAERVAATVVQGVHGRRRIGMGETFWQFRPYEPGGRPQLIDWRQSAKSDRVFVRDLEWEAAQSLWLWRDASGSMCWQSAEAQVSKVTRATILLLAIASLLVRGGERVTLLGSGFPPGNGRPALLRMALALDREMAETDSFPPQGHLPRHARLLLFSDFLSPLDEIEERLRHFAARGVGGHLVQILDPAELSFPFSGRLAFEGLEQERSWLLSRSEAVRSEYRQRLNRHRMAVADLARRLSWTYSLHHTDRSAESALLQLYQTVTDAPISGRAR